jgi:hypothetical protein
MNQERFVTEEPVKITYWQKVLDKSRVQFLALDRYSDSELIKLFRAHPGWVVDFESKEVVLFARAVCR